MKYRWGVKRSQRAWVMTTSTTRGCECPTSRDARPGIEVEIGAAVGLEEGVPLPPDQDRLVAVGGDQMVIQ